MPVNRQLQRSIKIDKSHTIESIGDYAFAGCTILESITIPSSVTSIGSRAFISCGNLTIYGEKDSYAQTYAEKNRIAFSDGEVPQNVKKIKISDCEIIMEPLEYVYNNGLTVFPNFTIRYGDIVLEYPTDYSFDFWDYTEARTARIQFTGIRKYKGFVEKNYTIIPREISDCEIILAQDSYTYDGIAKRPEISIKNEISLLTEETDYTVEYLDNIEPGTARAIITGTGNYTGTITKTFTIMALEPSSPPKEELSPGENTSGEENPDVPKDENLSKPSEEEDPSSGTTPEPPKEKDPSEEKPPELPGKDNSSDGKPASTSKEKNNPILNYRKTYQKTYGNKPFPLNVKLADGHGALTYTSSNKKVIAVTNKGKATIKGTGIAVITLKVGAMQNYKEAEAKITVKVKPAKQKIKSLKTQKNGKLKVSWKRDKQATGYQIQIWHKQNSKRQKERKKYICLLKKEEMEAADRRNNEKQQYTFDTNYLTSICGEAKNGKYVIAAQITDNAGNVAKNKATYYIDKVSPTIDRIDFTPKTSDGIENTAEFMEELSYGYYFKTDFKVTINVSDAKPSSGLHEVRYRFVPYQDGRKQKEISGSKKIRNGKAVLDVPKGFKGQIFVEAFDYVLNRSGEKTTKAYVIDRAAPDIEITKNVNTSCHDAAGNNLYVGTNSFTVVVTDTVSGIKQIGYLKSAEQDPYDRKTIDINPEGYSLNEDLGDGWRVTGVDVNLVTQVKKTFTFPEDDNDIILTFDATDYSLNKTENVQSEKFTVDKTAPVINIVFREDDDTDMYYNQNRVADITVIERNFDENRIKVEIENTFGNVPGYSFTEESNTEHTAVIDFDEGDYTFDLTGMDLGDHPAIVNFSGGNEKMFYVDKTMPVIEENFAEFSSSEENSFHDDKTVNIKITEHNFDPELVNLKITRKEAGAGHSANGMEDATGIVLGGARWESTGDVHTISFTIGYDAVYYIEMAPADLATNIADPCSTVIFEIDKTAPVVSMKNGSFVGEDDTEFLDVYPYARKDDDAPTVEFEDLNLSHLEYKLTVYIPDYSTADAVVVRPSVTSGTIEQNKYTLPDFEEDGVYALELVAVDVAGNKSAVNFNTYARMVNQDVLAFVMDSNPEEKTGVYSFEYENGEAISKKPSDFKDLEIFVMTKKETVTDIVLRDNDGQEIFTNAQCTVDDSIYGIGICSYLLRGDFFKENFQDDTDMELRLTVKNQGQRIDLGKMHIDNIAPTCTMPDNLNSWHWIPDETDQTFTLSNISELVDEKNCVIYDNGKEMPFVYSSDDATITFTLAKGWHNVGIILDDMAGNANNIQEKINLHIGYFWFWVIGFVSVFVIATIICIAIYIQSRRKRELQDIY